MNVLRILQYGKYFTNDRLWGAVSKFRKNMGLVKKVLVLYYCMNDPDTPKYVKAVALGALGYFVSPIDILPDALPVIGTIDDAAVVGFAMGVANRYIKPVHWERAMQKLAWVDFAR